MRHLIVFFLFAIIGCKSKALELEIITPELSSLDVKAGEYKNFIKVDTVAVKDARTILVYKLTNHSDETYYFNLDDYNNGLENHFIRMDRVFVGIIDNQGKYVNARGREPDRIFNSKFLFLEYLGYDYTKRYDSKNFIIHPNETLYFEWFIVLPFGNLLEETNYRIQLDSNKKYFAEILMNSDSANYKKTISRTDLKTIQDNGYKVFNGTIKSKNKIPIVFK